MAPFFPRRGPGRGLGRVGRRLEPSPVGRRRVRSRGGDGVVPRLGFVSQ